ncbi:glucan endo-1,3-beta-glucosidase, acidic-like [Magnolia sinica]|uniref:glucan endo-1,3-beta-glucosidase, acidic-like n=1 Tax=Magnolia sinica TaxID=86752 RepID=UPI00265992DA|nr:glucan endo-1,3-beta-glucosidase, acidic-like [Magnolia sinica]
MKALDNRMATFTENGYLSKLATILLIGALMGSFEITGAQSIGICYGRTATIDGLPSEPEVVELYKSINVQRMRIFDANQNALDAFRGSGIEVTVGVTNDELEKMADPTAANNWVRDNIVTYGSDVKFRYISVGNEVFPDTKTGSYDRAAQVLPAMRNIYNAIRSVGLQDQIKVSTAVYPNILENSYVRPSQGIFNTTAAQYMRPIISFLVETGAPLLANVYPYFTKKFNGQIDLSYVLFTSTAVNQDGYQNLFDAMVDTLYFAVEKAGGPSVKIVILESGWPSAGGEWATKENSQTYNQNLIRHVAKGTPKKPGPIETYVFAMFNENLKETEEERSFGLFYPNKTPVYAISFN